MSCNDNIINLQNSLLRGPKGEKGDKGDPGAVGPAGLNWRGAWADAVYVEDDAVSYNGSTYFCILAISSGVTTPNLDTTHWALLSSQGAKGDKGDTGDTGGAGPAGCYRLGRGQHGAVFAG